MYLVSGKRFVGRTDGQYGHPVDWRQQGVTDRQNLGTHVTRCTTLPPPGEMCTIVTRYPEAT